MHVHDLRSAEDLQKLAVGSYMPVVSEPSPGFRGRFALHDLSGSVSLSDAHAGALRTFRTARMATSTSGPDLLLFCVHLAGGGRLHQHGRIAELAPGAGVLYESRSAFELALTDVHSLTLHFPRDLLPVRSDVIAEACARSMDPRSPSMRLLAGYLGQLHQLADDLSAGQRHDAGQAALELLTMALRDVPPAVPADGSASEVLLRMMATHVRDHLGDARLTVEELARRHHVSVRHAYTVFSRIGVTPGAFIREERLLAARTMLSNPRFDVRSMSDIGAAVGFPELRTFERAFRRHYGTTPVRWRREHRDGQRPGRRAGTAARPAEIVVPRGCAAMVD